MAEITPAPPAATLLASQTAIPLTLPALPGLLPPALPAVIVALPPELQNPAQPITLDGNLQLLAGGKAALTTTQGAIQLDLPQLRGNLGLTQAVRNYIVSQLPLQLQLTPQANGQLDAQLLFSAVSATRSAASSVMLPQAAPQLTGQMLQAIVVPAPPQTASISPPPAQPSPPAAAPPQPQNTAAPATAAPALLSTITARLEQQVQQVRQLFVLNVAAETASSAPPVLPPASAQNPPIIHLRVQSVIPPGQPPPAAQADEVLFTVPNSADTLPAPLLTTSSGSLMLKAAPAAPPGTTFLLKILPQTLAPPPSSPEAAADSPAALPVLKRLLAESAAMPELQHFMQLRLPQFNPALPGAMLMLMGALRQNEPRAWLGKQGIAALEQTGKKTMLDALESELRQSVGRTSDPVIGDWRVYQLPMFDQHPPQHFNPLPPLYVYVHHNQPDGGQNGAAEPETKPQQTRFVIDVTFTRLGAMQLDGFVKPQHFDLMLRSLQPLPPALRDELRTTFLNVLAATGYEGQMLFQQGRQNWLVLGQHASDSRQA